MRGPLNDQERALLFLYVLQVGLPMWAQHPRGQIQLMTLLFDWTEERAETALIENKKQGFANQMTPNTDDILDAGTIDS